MGEELRDDQWALIEPLLPAHKGRGRPRADDRRTLNGILWILRSGARWKDLPPKYGSRSTCHRRLQEWQEQGVWERMRVPRPTGRPRQRPASLGADRSYDSADFRHGLRRRGIQSSVPCRRWPHRRRRPGRPPETHDTSKSRWKVERSHGWLDNWRRLVTRYDWYTQSYVAFLAIALFMTALAKLVG
jgi:transposase